MNNNHKTITSSQWTTDIKEATTSLAPSFEIHDTSGKPIIIEWKLTDILSPELTRFKAQISDLASTITARKEVKFLQKYPEAVSQEMFLKQCEVFFKDGVEDVDWSAVEATIQEAINNFYLMDISQLSEDILKKVINDLHFSVSAKDKESGNILGFTMFSVTPALAYGDVKVINTVITPAAEDKEIEKILMSSVFKIIPKTERIFLGTRPTNETEIDNYMSWGFTLYENFTQDPNHAVNAKYFSIFEYNAQQSTTLQKLAEQLQ